MSTLEQLVQECAASGVARRVLLLRPHDGLAGAWLEGPHRARNALDCMTRHARARRHELSGHRWAVSWPGDNPALAPTLADLAHLAPGYDASVYDLPRDGGDLLSKLDGTAHRHPAAPHGAPLDDATLELLERGLANADLSRFVRRSRVVRRTGDGMQTAWEKRYVCLSDLAQTLAPGADPLADRTRLRRLGRSLDNGMLRLLTGPRELDGAAPFALNLNAGSVAGAEFARFDAGLPAALRGHVVLMFSLDDALADPAGYADARDDVRARGYRVLLRGLDATLAAAVAFDRLAPDLVQLAWSPALARRPLALNGIEAVLSRVEGAAALRWAARAGVHLFQAAA